jgi:hypothetical protein
MAYASHDLPETIMNAFSVSFHYVVWLGLDDTSRETACMRQKLRAYLPAPVL